MRKLKIIVILMFIISCGKKKDREIVLNNKIRAVGNISVDTVYDGIIKFYSIATSRLERSETFKDGKRTGEFLDYFPNGQVRSRGNYEDEQLHGNILVYDSTGFLIYSQHYYYGLIVGPRINYVNGIANEYEFYSFDNEPLLQFNYDSLRERELFKMQKGFFFFNKRYYLTVEDGDTSVKKKREYFIYLPSPPKMKFVYSLVEADSNYKTVTTKCTFDAKDVFSTFEIDDYIPNRFQIRLVVEDSVNESNYTMYKKL